MDFELEKRKIVKHFIIGFLLIITSYFLKLIFEPPTQKILNKITINLPVNNLPASQESTGFRFY